VPALLAPALGPVLGGVIVDGLSWRWIFYVNVPAGVALNGGAAAGWVSPGIQAAIAAGVILLAVFARVELRTAEPLLQLRILANRMFRTASLQMAVGSGGFTGTLFLVPAFLQNGLGYSALHSGMC
jgi:hypothetical protein